jgi:hypothetical protein
MGRPFSRVRVSAVSLVATVGLALAGAAPATAGEEYEVSMPAWKVEDFQANPDQAKSCLAKIYARVRDVPGATRYRVYRKRFDTYGSKSGPPFQDDVTQSYFHHVAPAGFHDLEIGNLAMSGGPGSGCPTS